MSGVPLTVFVSAVVVPVVAVAAGAPRWDNRAVAGAGMPAFAYEVVPFFPGVTFPVPIYTEHYGAGGEGRILVTCTNGQLFSMPADGGEGGRLPAPVFDFRLYLARELGTRPQDVQLRLFSSLFDREFPERPYLYLFANNRDPGPARDQIVRFEVVSTEPLELANPVEVIAWDSNGHDGGDMAWGPEDGMLYITAGDRSAPGDPNNWGQRTDDIFGSVLRIDVHAAGPEPYAVPADNPFVGVDGTRPEIWSYGLRNPFRLEFHPESGELWVADNGDESWEMVHRVERGANAGWSAFEGSHVFRPGNALGGPTLTHTPAIVQQPHSEMRSVIGGMFYRGEAFPELRGHYLYGCYFTKRLWAFDYRSGEPGAPFLIADAGGQLVALVEGPDLEPVVTCHDGGVFRLERREARGDARPWPGKLSETGLFVSAEEHTFAPGVYPYFTNAESWADGATRQHFVAVAGGGKMKAQGGMMAHKCFTLPEGSLVGQTLSIGGRRVETQLLYFDGSWRGYTYRWDAAGRDAGLVPEGGLDAEVGGGQPWRFLSRAECMVCHTHRSDFALTLKPGQLERPGAGGENQLDAWIEGGLLADDWALKSLRGKVTPDPHDGALPLEARARSYLELNCAHCHRETGLGGRAGFQLLADLPLGETGVLDAKPVVGLLGRDDARVVAPGDPGRSELLGRMARRGAGQMPLVGSQVVDERGVELVREWIESLAE